jgi:adenylate cyclase
VIAAAFVITFDDGGVSRSVALGPGETLVGRAPACDVALAAPGVSRQHARFRVDAGRIYVRDAGSSYGTYRNGERVSGETELAAGDVVRLGDAALRIDRAGAAGQPARDSGPAAVLEDRPLPAGAETLWRPVDRDAPLPGTAATDAGRLVRLLSETARTLVAVQPVHQVLARIVDLVFDSVPAERAFVLLQEGDGTLKPAVVRNRDGSRPADARVSRTAVDEAIRARASMLASDTSIDPRLAGAASIVALKVRSFMCAPLWDRDQVIGALYVDNAWTNRFSPADLEVFTALSNYAAVAIAQARLAEQLLQETRRRERLERYHSPAVVNRIVAAAGEGEAGIPAQERDLSVLFADIVGFTAASERLPPREIVALLSAFFERMADVIFTHEGTLDKFIGDCVMAVFGAPFEQADHARRAVDAARAMRGALAEFNRESRIVPLEIRTGINSGVAMMGDVGSPRRREFAVLGDVVNTASRLERMASPGQILVSRATWEQIRDDVPVRPLGRMTVRGRAGELDVYEVL